MLPAQNSPYHITEVKLQLILRQIDSAVDTVYNRYLQYGELSAELHE
jgi:hypothetical protein